MVAAERAAGNGATRRLRTGDGPKSSLQNELYVTAVADEATAEREHRFVHLAASLVADEQPLELMQMREGALDDPSDGAEAGAVLGLAARDHRSDPPLADEPAVLVMVVAPVAHDLHGAATWPTDQAAHVGHTVKQRDQLRDVVAVAAGQRPGKRRPVRIDEEVVLGAATAAVDRARARFGAPFFACTWLASTIARDHSTSPAARSFDSNSACSLSQTPARCHSSSRRQQVKPEPKPSSCGRCIHGVPVCSTNRIPDSACRSGNRFRPGFRTRRVTFGNNGSTSSHNSSLTSHGGLALIDTPLSLTTDADAIRHQPRGPFILK